MTFVCNFLFPGKFHFFIIFIMALLFFHSSSYSQNCWIRICICNIFIFFFYSWKYKINTIFSLKRKQLHLESCPLSLMFKKEKKKLFIFFLKNYNIIIFIHPVKFQIKKAREIYYILLVFQSIFLYYCFMMIKLIFDYIITP